MPQPPLMSPTATATSGLRLVIGGDKLFARAKDVQMDYEHLPFLDRSVDVVIFDPPFQPQTTRVTEGVTEGRFRKIDGGIPAVKASVQAGCAEAMRVARLGLIVKVQDYIHSHRPVWMSMWVWEALGEPYDFLTLRAGPKMKATNWTEQKSVWRNHSTFWVYRKKSLR